MPSKLSGKVAIVTGSSKGIGAEIARQEKAGLGSVPLTTLQADVNYGYAIAYTTYGTIGVKTWIYRGMYGDENLVAETDVRPGGGLRRGRR